MIYILIEIVSALQLPGDHSIDAYIVVHQGSTLIHQTDTIKNSINPIWTIKTGALFLLQTTPDQFFSSSSGLVFTIKNDAILIKDNIIGKVRIAHNDVLYGDGSRQEYSIESKQNINSIRTAVRQKLLQPKLVLRIKPASTDDIQFMETLAIRGKETKGLYAEKVFIQPRHVPMNLLKIRWRTNDSEEREVSIQIYTCSYFGYHHPCLFLVKGKSKSVIFYSSLFLGFWVLLSTVIYYTKTSIV